MKRKRILYFSLADFVNSRQTLCWSNIYLYLMSDRRRPDGRDADYYRRLRRRKRRRVADGSDSEQSSEDLEGKYL